jgi:hypothetical protein
MHLLGAHDQGAHAPARRARSRCTPLMRLIGAHDQGAQEAKGPRKYVSSKLK